jgi:hypothetical protein
MPIGRETTGSRQPHRPGHDAAEMAIPFEETREDFLLQPEINKDNAPEFVTRTPWNRTSAEMFEWQGSGKEMSSY